MVSATAFGRLSVTAEMRISLTVFSTSSLDRAIKEENPPGVDPYQDRHVYNREDYTLYPYKSHWQPFRAWYGLVTCCLLVIFNGWRSIVPQWSTKDFIPSYINVSCLPAARKKYPTIIARLIFLFFHFLATYLPYPDRCLSCESRRLRSA
jgi:hypothetical protein